MKKFLEKLEKHEKISGIIVVIILLSIFGIIGFGIGLMGKSCGVDVVPYGGP